MNNTERRRFEDKAILVSGSTRGIGRAIAERLLAEGATIGIHGRNASAVEGLSAEMHADRAIPVAADLSDPAAARGMVETFLAACGRLDGIVNNAGGGRPAAFRALTLESWREPGANPSRVLVLPCGHTRENGIAPAEGRRPGPAPPLGW